MDQPLCSGTSMYQATNQFVDEPLSRLLTNLLLVLSVHLFLPFQRR